MALTTALSATAGNSFIQSQKKKLDSLILLRGVAVLLVCADHLMSWLYPDLEKLLNLMGRYGVHIFFVVSGFVIPLSLYKGKYVTSDYGHFLYKRFLRLQLPYIASVCFTYLFVLVSVFIQHLGTEETVWSFLQTFFYAHIPNLNSPYWTLIVEVQYYFSIGLLFPLLLSRPALAGILFLFIPLLSYYLFGEASELSTNFLGQSPFFFIGITGFMLYADLGRPWLNIVTLTCLFALVLWLSPIADFVSSLLALSFILFYTYPVTEWLQFPGKVSYSVYLIHYPLSMYIIQFLAVKTGNTYKSAIFLFALLIVFTAGYLFYKWFEVPSEMASAKVKYKQGNYPLHPPVKEQSTGEIEEVTVQ